MQVEFEEACFDTGKVLLNYARGPQTGPPLVLLHGGSGCWQNLYPLLPDLALNWQVFAPDLRGHGKSGRAAWRYALRDYAEDIAAFLEEVSGPAFLFGHSLGGIVALMTAKRYPENIRTVIIGDAPLDAATWQVVLERSEDRLRQWRAMSGGSVPLEDIMAAGYDEWMATRLYQQDPDVLGVLLDDFENAAAGYEMEAVLPAIQCPVLLLQADPQAGGVLADAEVARALPLLAQPSHVRLTGLSHIFFVEQKEPALKAMEEFLNPLR